MNNELNRSEDFFNSENEMSESLWKYVQSLSPETISQLSKPDSKEDFVGTNRTPVINQRGF